MIESPLCRDENARLQALDALAILDTEPEERYDRITHIAKQLFNVPIALISLVDRNRQWFKSRQGLADEELPRNVSFCGHTLNQDDLLYISDTLKDPRFFDNPLVTGHPHIRFYLGAPLRLKDNLRIGTLCVVDVVPREISLPQRQALRFLADIVEVELQSLQMAHMVALCHRADSYLQAIWNNAPSGIITMSCDGIVQALNPAAAQILGSNANQGIGSHFSSLLIEPYRSTFRHLNNRSNDFSALIDGEHEVEAKKSNGKVISLLLSISAASINEERIFVALFSDATQRKALEAQQRLHADQLEAANRDLESFSYFVAHDLRAPIRHINGFVDALEYDYGSSLDVSGRDLLSRIRKCGKQMGQHVEDLLRLARVTREPLQKAKLNLSKTINAYLVEKCAEDPGRKLTSNIAENIVVTADPRLITLVLTNLIDNAWKYTDPAKTTEITFTAQTKDDEIVCCLGDNGVGFDMKDAKRVFTLFERLRPEANVPGIGIGLSICSRIIERHGGRIWVESEPGVGTRFYFSLPLSPPSD